MKKRNRLTLCLVAGVLVLAVSAGAAFGSVNGYSKYKEGLKDLALKTNNVTLAGTVTMKVDDQELFQGQVDWAGDGDNYSSVSSATYQGKETEKRYDTTLNGVSTWYNEGDTEYQQYTTDSKETNGLLRITSDDEFSKRMINFMEIATDTVVGDLKNNFVQIGKDGGNTIYQVEVAQNQVPSIVNAGLSVMAYGLAQDNATGRVEYEDYAKSAVAYYEKSTGETLSQEIRDAWLGEGDMEALYDGGEKEAALDKFYDVITQDWENTYYQQLEKQGDKGVVYVHTDGTTDYFADYRAFVDAHPDYLSDSDLVQMYLGDDLALKNVTCRFGVDGQDRLTSNTITATFTTTDAAGAAHTVEMTMDATASDYGTTVVQPLDVTGLTKANMDNLEME